MTFEFFLIIHVIFAVLAYPAMLYCEFNSYARGHRHVTYWRGAMFLVAACIPVVNVFSLCVVVYATYGDAFRAILSRHMFRETK